MVVHISAELLRKASDPAIARVLRRLFALFDDEDLTWYLRPEDDSDLFLCPALAGFENFIQEYAKKQTWSSKPPKRVVRVVGDKSVEPKAVAQSLQLGVGYVMHAGDRRASIRGTTTEYDFVAASLAKKYLAQPLKVVVEDIESDACFVSACLKHFAQEAPDDLFLEFRHGGGSSIIKVLRSIRGRERVVCIIDSDKSGPNTVDPIKAKAHVDIRQVCESNGYDLVILKKREIENYLPDSALERWWGNSGHPYFALSPDEKDFFDLKKGTTGRKAKKPGFSTLTNQTAAAAMATNNLTANQIDGFGDDVWRAFYEVRDAAELAERDGKGELEQLVSAIRESL